MDTVDSDVFIPIVLQQTELELYHPHLEVKLVIRVAVPRHPGFIVEVLQVEMTEIVKTGCRAYYPWLMTPCQGWEEMQRHKNMGYKVDLSVSARNNGANELT